jgi:hypothetical protein
MHTTPARLRPFLDQWDHQAGELMDWLDGTTDDEYLWLPAPGAWTVRERDGRGVPDDDPDAELPPVRTLAWLVGHIGAGALVRADWTTGSHSLRDEDIEWPLRAAEGRTFLRAGLDAWRGGLETMTDADLDEVGRSQYPRGLDPDLPLLDIVWWVNREMILHTGEVGYVRALYAARETNPSDSTGGPEGAT